MINAVPYVDFDDVLAFNEPIDNLGTTIGVKSASGEKPEFKKHGVVFPTGHQEVDDLIADDRLLEVFGNCLSTGSPRFSNAHLFVRTEAVDRQAGLVAAGKWHIDHDTDSYLPPHPDWQRYSYVNCHIYLDNIDAKDAPMCLLPGSHRLIATCASDFLRSGSITRNGHVERLPERAWEAPFSAVGPIGSVLLYSSLLLHRAVPFLDPNSQRSLMTGSMFRADSSDWRRSSWPHAFRDRSAANAFVAATTPRMRTALGWPPPGDTFYTRETLQSLSVWYPGIDLAPYELRLNHQIPSDNVAS